MKRIILVSLCVLLAFAGTSCTSEKSSEDDQNLVKIENQEKEITRLNNLINELNKELEEYKSKEETFNEEREFYLDFISSLIEPMSQEYLKQIAQRQWTYNILIDGEPIPEDGIIELDESRFDLTVSEEQTPYRALPIEIHEKGKISGDLFSNHIKFLNVKPSDTTGSEEENRTSATYSFENVTETVVTLEISDELKDRIGLNTNVITIKVNKN